MKLSERQKELLQEDKYSLVDMIVLLEHKLEKLVEELKRLLSPPKKLIN